MHVRIDRVINRIQLKCKDKKQSQSWESAKTNGKEDVHLPQRKSRRLPPLELRSSSSQVTTGATPTTSSRRLVLSSRRTATKLAFCLEWKRFQFQTWSKTKHISCSPTSSRHRVTTCHSSTCSSRRSWELLTSNASEKLRNRTPTDLSPLEDMLVLQEPSISSEVAENFCCRRDSKLHWSSWEVHTCTKITMPWRTLLQESPRTLRREAYQRPNLQWFSLLLELEEFLKVFLKF